MVVEGGLVAAALDVVAHELRLRGLEGGAADDARRQVATQGLSPLLEVADLVRVFGRLVEVGRAHGLVGQRQAEAVAELDEVLGLDLLLLVRDVHALAGLAQAVALDGRDEDDRWRPLVLHGGLVSGVDLGRVVAAAFHLGNLLVRQVLDQFEQFGVLAEEVLADVRPRLDGILLQFAIDHLVHALHQQAGLVAGQERIPVSPPDDLDAVPAGAAESRLQLLDDLAIAAHRAIETLQIAVDDEDEVVQPFARGQSDGAERLRFVAFAVAEEAPDVLLAGLLEAAVFEVAIEAGLVNGHDRPQPHRHRRELPEVRHQPGMRIRRQAAALGQLLPEVLQLLFGEAAFEVGAGVDAGRGVALEVNLVAAAGGVAALEKVVLTHLVDTGRRREGGNVAAEGAVLEVGLDHHGHGVPADQTLDTPLQVAVARLGRLAFGGNSVDVGRVGGERQFDARADRLVLQLSEKVAGPVGAFGLKDRVERVEPLPRFKGIGISIASRRLGGDGTIGRHLSAPGSEKVKRKRAAALPLCSLYWYRFRQKERGRRRLDCTTP